MITSTAPNQHWFFNAVTGWVKPPGDNPVKTPIAKLEQSSDGLALDSLPGAAIPWGPAIADRICCAGAIAIDECGWIYVLDVACGRVWHVDSSRLTPINAFGGTGSERRQFKMPRGLALRFGSFLVSDTGNHRVQVFSRAPYALIQVWGRADGTAGSGKLEFHRPWGIAVDRCGNSYVADRGNCRVQKIARDGQWLEDIGVGLLNDPTELAIGPKGILAIVDGADGAQGGRLVLYGSGGAPPQIIAALQVVQDPNDRYNQTITILPEIPAAQSTPPPAGAPPAVYPLKGCAVAFEDDGTLYVAASTGVVHRFEPDPEAPGQYTFIGTGVSGQGAPVHIRSQRAGSLFAIIPGEKSGLRELWQIPTDGSFVPEGTMLSDVLDGGADDCVWDRVILNATLPFGTSLQVEYFTSADRPKDPPLDPTKPGLTSSRSSGSYTFVSTESDPDTTPPPPPPTQQDWTCLVNTDAGRYLQFRLTFRSNTQSTPRLNSASVYFPRDSYLQYLPAVFQEDPQARAFMERFLANFKETVDGFDAMIDGMVGMLDPDSVPEGFLPWLAGWIDFPIDPRLKIATQRSLLKNAIKNSRTKGTISGLKQAVVDLLELLADPCLSDAENEVVRRTMDINVVEHFKLRKWPILRATGFLGNAGDRQARLWSRDFYQRLQVGKYSQVGNFVLTDTPIPAAESAAWGAHEFSLFFSAHPLRVDSVRQKLETIVEREKPAHTKANIVPVLPRFRIGVQSTLGVDSRVGVCTPLVLGTVSRLGYDAILASSPALREMQNIGTSAPAILGSTTRLF